MIVSLIPCLNDNLCYLVASETNETTLLVDASVAKAIRKALADCNRKPNALLLTHHHHDHIGALGLLDSFPLYCSNHDRSRVGYSGTDHSPSMKIGLSDDEVFKIGDFEIKAHRLRGHTAGQIGFEIRSGSDVHFFAGDTLFSFGCGRCMEGTPEELFESMRQILRLPPQTRLHFGHEYTERNFLFWQREAERSSDPWLVTWLKRVQGFQVPGNGDVRPAPTLLEEMDINPFLILAQMGSMAEFVKWRKKRDGF